MNSSAYIRLGYEFEKIVADNSNVKLAIEVKISRDINAHSDIILKSAERVRMAAVRDNRSPMIVTASLVSQRLRENLKRYPECEALKNVSEICFIIKPSAYIEDEGMFQIKDFRISF